MTAFDATKPVQRRDGCKAEIVRDDLNSKYPIVAVITLVDGRQEAVSYTATGKWIASSRRDETSDLINVPVQHERWVNFYKYGPRDEISVGGGTYASHAVAKAASGGGPFCIACVRVEFTEGDGLSVDEWAQVRKE